MLYSKLHLAAREYALNGWPVHRITPNSKLPAGKWKDEATTDLNIIDSWWEDAEWNIGFCPANAGMCVVDVDEGGGTALGASLYSPAVVVTPHGRHLYFAGSLPPTVSKIAPKVDTRGIDSYVLLPPSIIDGKRYEECWKEVPQAWDIPEIPQWVIEKCSKIEPPRNRPETIKTEVTDRPQAIKLFKRYLDNNPIPPEGEGSDDATYRAVARGRDLGLSDGLLLDLLVAASDFDEEYLLGKLVNAERYQQNEAGCDTPETGQEKFGKLAERYLSEPGSEGGLTETEALTWVPHDPRDPADMPAIEFHDPDKCIPKPPDGAIGTIYGTRGHHKTNLILSMLTLSSAQRILYAAGEGSYGVERDRIAARPELKGRIKILPRVPLLGQPEQVKAFIDGCNSLGEWKPEIVVIDTWANAAGGEDDNSSQTAWLLTDNGPCGTIKRAWNCTVVIIDHAGKDASRGIRGSSAKEGNVDFILQVKADKKVGAIELHVDKMRDGYDGFSTYWVYENDPNVVPVPTKISEQEFIGLTTVQRDDKSPIGMAVVSWLRLNGHHTWATGVETSELATAMTEQELGDRPDDVTDQAAWDTCRAKWVKSLNNNRGKEWAKKATDEQMFPGGSKLTLRWFSTPPQDQDEF